MDQHQEIVERRKEKFKKFLFQKKNYLQYLLLTIVISIGAYIRAQPLKNLVDVTTGKYITLELDSTLWLRYAKEIVEHSILFQIDPLRAAPFGADLTGLGTFTAYFIAYLYKVLNLFVPSLTIEYAANVYPIVATIILSIFLFLLVRRLFDWRVGLISVLLLNVIPSFLFRSMGGSSDHDILAMMFFIMAIYFYIVGWQSIKRRHNILFGVLAGILTAVGRESAGLINFLFLIIGIIVLIEVFLDKFNEQDYFTFLGWFVITIMYLLFISESGGITTVLTSFTVSPIVFAFLASTLYYMLTKGYIFKDKFKSKPLGAMSIAVSFITGLLVSMLYLGTQFITSLPLRFTGTLSSFVSNRWVTTVAENHVSYVTDWFGQMGKMYIYLMLIGSIFLFYEAVKNIPYKKWITFTYTIFIFSFTFSRFSPNSLLNGTSFLSKLLFYGSLTGFFIGGALFYIIAFYKKKEIISGIKGAGKKYTFLIIWFVTMIIAATTAIRLLFEFTPVTTIITAFALVYILDLCWRYKNQYVKWMGVIFIAALLFAPFSYGLVPNYYQLSLSQSKGSGPGYTQLWQYAGKWARENTPQDAIFAHWWDYGYWVQSGFERPTITDGGNFIGWWNFLIGRYVLTGNSTEDSLKFLYAHNASYVLVVSDEIGKYPAYSLIGSDASLDRYSSIPLFQLDPSGTQETKNKTLLLYRGGVALDQNLIIQERLYPANSAGIGGFILAITQTNTSISVEQPQAIISYQDQQVSVPLRCLYFGNTKQLFEGPALEACLRVVPVFQNTQVNPMGAVMYLSQKVKDSFFARAYVGDENLPGFELVYDSEGQVPLGIYSGRLFGPLRIWKINYPRDLQLTEDEYEYYTRRNYPDEKLYSL